MTFPTDHTTGYQTITPDDELFADVFKALRQQEKPADELYICSHNLEDLMARKRVAIVGSRKVTSYGRMVTEKLAGELAGQGIAIVSGLAFGVDSIAHRAALDAGGVTIAVLPSSLSRIYPTAHEGLARRILEQGGALISEYPVGSDIAFKNQFVDRNRIVSALSDALVITEAAKDSGSMHTAEYALAQGKTVLCVPGNIDSPICEGTNNLLRSLKAQPIATSDDIIHAIGLEKLGEQRVVRGRSKHEQTLINLLAAGVHSGSDLLERSGMDVSEYNHTLTMLEITSRIMPLGNNHWALR